jgi:cysteinyl-tRNA synthetase
MALLDDDLDTPAAVARLFDAVSEAHAAADGGDLDRATHIAHDVMVFFGALGLRLDGTGANVDAESATLAAQRDDARRRKDFAEADRLRDELVSRGWIVEDSAHGTVLRPV